jgi:predicted metal-binding membrane protein
MRRLLYAVPALEAFLRSGRLVVAAGLVALVLLSWLYLALTAEAMRAMEAGNSSPFMWLMPMGSWGASQFVLCFAMWAVMMIAMMTPSAAPMLFAFHALDRARPGRGSSARRFGAFLLGYVGVWSSFSVMAAAVQWWLHETAVVTEMMISVSRVFDAVVLLGAGAYQLTPAKNRCLSKCRSPMGFLLTEWRDGTSGALIMGVRHGAFCVGCCWGLMALLFVGGVMNLLWIALLAAVVLIEKVVPFGDIVAKAIGLVMCAVGVWLLLPA